MTSSVFLSRMLEHHSQLFWNSSQEQDIKHFSRSTASPSIAPLCPLCRTKTIACSSSTTARLTFPHPEPCLTSHSSTRANLLSTTCLSGLKCSATVVTVSRQKRRSFLRRSRGSCRVGNVRVSGSYEENDRNGSTGLQHFALQMRCRQHS